MSETRKAGSEEFKQELSEASSISRADRAARNRAARERMAADPESAAARLSSVDREKYDVSGYSDKDIVMAYQGADFTDEDYARLTGKGSTGSGGGEEKKDEVVAPPKIDEPVVGEPDPGSDAPVVGEPSGPEPEDFLGLFIKNSFNAKGGTLNNSGNITAQRDVTLDNSVTNSNTFNNNRSNGYRLDFGNLKLG